MSEPETMAAAVVDRLRRTFDSERTKSLAWRRRQLQALDRMLDREGDALAGAIDADMRRGDFEGRLFDIVPTRTEVQHALKELRRWTRPRHAPVPLISRPGRAWVQYEPLGVVLVVSPWNYPVHLALGPLVGAIAAGNCAVVKPSELTPHVSAALADLIPRYLDPDAFAVVEGGADETLALIDQRLDHVFFTGSPGVGRAVMKAAAEHLTPVTLELGGKSPAVVTRSADLEVAARRIAFAKLTNSGQTCVAVDHVLVDRHVRDRFVDVLVRTIDDFSEHRPQPILDAAKLERLRGLLTGAGGEIRAGGEVDEAGLRMRPVIVVDPRPDSALMEEEIFGPILPVVTVDSLDDAIVRIRRGTKPLASYLFTASGADERRFLRRVSAGGTVINHALVHLNVPELPFGGVGTSGTGNYHGSWGFETFSHPKAVLRQSTRVDLPLIYPPYRGLKRRIMRRAL